MENVFSHILGSEYEQLPQAVKYFHEVPKATFVGSANVRGSTNLIAMLVRKVFSFPVPSESTPVLIKVERTAYIDKWDRDFAGRKFSSSFVKKANGDLLSESFGPFKFYFSLSVSSNRMNWNFEKWALGVIPLPKVLGPKITSWETEGEAGSFRFFSEAHFPILGQLIYYDGTVFVKKTEQIV